MICTLKWNIGNAAEWVKHFNSIRRCNILQSYSYAYAVASLYNQRARLGVIQINGHNAGIVLMMEVGLLNNILHAIVVDRGPLWFEDYGSQAHFNAFMAELNRQFPKRWGRKRRIIPEMADSQAVQDIMTAHGFKKTSQPPYQTIWLDITKNTDELRTGLRKSWRQSLVKAEKSALTIEWDTKGRTLNWLLKAYDLDKQRRGFPGPDSKILRALGSVFAQEEKCLIGIAKLDNRPVAAILILCHGQSATYQIGWSTQDGRNTCAHHLLLWDSIAHLKAQDIKEFDLGGVNDEQAASIKTFKGGMGGDLVRLAGLYTS